MALTPTPNSATLRVKGNSREDGTRETSYQSKFYGRTPPRLRWGYPSGSKIDIGIRSTEIKTLRVEIMVSKKV